MGNEILRAAARNGAGEDRASTKHQDEDAERDHEGLSRMIPREISPPEIRRRI